MQYKSVKWPFDDQYAKKCFCYVTKAPGRNAHLYVHRPINSNVWSYTLDAGPNNERSHSGGIGESLSIEEAFSKAISSCIKSNSWE